MGLFVQHSGYLFPRVFGPSTGNDAIYADVGSPMVAQASEGSVATLFMFGQTGSGKTYTMKAIIEPAARELIASIRGADGEKGSRPALQLRAFELVGKRCMDLFAKPQVQLKLLENEDGQTNVVGAVEVAVDSAEELVRAVHSAFLARSTASHGRNEESSRSHCVCVVDIPSSGGSVVLVDCAGSERRQDSEQHTADRTRESAEINASLHVLKECIRCRATAASTSKQGESDATPTRAPYRESLLTRVLQDSFTRQGAHLFVVGTLAPASIDTEHSLSTLRTLKLLENDSSGSSGTAFEEKVSLHARVSPEGKA